MLPNCYRVDLGCKYMRICKSDYTVFFRRKPFNTTIKAITCNH